MEIKYNIDMDKYSDIISYNNGVLEVNDKTIEHDVVNVNETNDLYLVHATDFFPENNMILSNSDGHKKIPFQYQVDNDIFVEKETTSPRQTVHFCLNGKVENTSLGEGKWDEPKYIIIEPYAGHEHEFVSGRMHGGDNFTNNSVKLSDKAILVVREDAFDSLTNEQKNMYNIVKYKGNPNHCIDNLFTSMNIPKIYNYADDKTHFMSKQFEQERVLEKRSQAIKLIKGVDLSHSIDNYSFSEKEIAALVKLGTINRYINQEQVEKLNKELNLNSEDLANFILSNGVVKIDTNSYSILSTPSVEQHINNTDFYIEKVNKSGTGLSELKHRVETTSIDEYQNESNLEKNYHFEDISVGQLQILQNFETLKHLKDYIKLEKNKVLILREDGLYVSDKIVNEIYGEIELQNYEEKNATEQLLGTNGETIRDVKNRYSKIVNIEYIEKAQIDELKQEISNCENQMFTLLSNIRPYMNIPSINEAISKVVAKNNEINASKIIDSIQDYKNVLAIKKELITFLRQQNELVKDNMIDREQYLNQLMNKEKQNQQADLLVPPMMEENQTTSGKQL